MIGYECFACQTRQPVSFAGYVCPACGGNLDILYDYEQIKTRVGRERLVTVGRPDIFRYAPLLPLARTTLAPPLRVGWTPLYFASRLAAEWGLRNLYLKDDSLNPSASFKDRASAVVLVRAREKGVRVVAAASTGNAGSSMACLAASVGMTSVIFVPEKAPPAKLAQLLVFGARVVAVRGTYDDAFDLCMKVAGERGWFNRNTGYNPFTREGKKTCAYEICEQLGWHAPDHVVVPVGDGNIISGLWKGMKDLYAVGLIDRLPRLHCAQSENSAAVTRAIEQVRATHPGGPGSIDWRTVRIAPVRATTIADSISVNAPRDGLAAVRAVVESNGVACAVPDEEILSVIPEIARCAGVFAEPAAACAGAVVKRLVRDGIIEPEDRVVCLITGSGLKDVAAARKAVGAPVVIEPTVEAARAALSDL